MTMMICINLLLHRSFSLFSDLFDLLFIEVFVLMDEYSLLDKLGTELMELLRRSPFFNLAKRLLILSS